MTTDLRRTYREAADLLAYAELNAPDFPPEDQMDWPKLFERLSHYYDAFLANETSSVALQWVRLSKYDLDAAKQFFSDRKSDEALAKIASARAYLLDATKRRSTKPGFLADDTGFSE
jgi:hypothetical protein